MVGGAYESNTKDDSNNNTQKRPIGDIVNEYIKNGGNVDVVD